MRALSAKQKEFIYSQLIFGRFRFIAKPCYDLIIGAILLTNRLRDRFSPKDKSDISDLTIIIKTFERHRSVNRLVNSIKRRYPSAKIIVINDSKNPREIYGVENIILPYDTGISFGRNTALERTTTKYFLLLDDDFVFSYRQNLGTLIDQMARYPQIDILGGRYIDLPIFTVHDFQKTPIHSNTPPVTPTNTFLGDNMVVDKVQNYFIGRTESVLKVRWNDALKTMEHTEFFSRARGILTTAYRDDMLILHAKTPFNMSYMMKRFRHTP